MGPVRRRIIAVPSGTAVGLVRDRLILVRDGRILAADPRIPGRERRVRVRDGLIRVRDARFLATDRRIRVRDRFIPTSPRTIPTSPKAIPGSPDTIPVSPNAVLASPSPGESGPRFGEVAPGSGAGRPSRGEPRWSRGTSSPGFGKAIRTVGPAWRSGCYQETVRPRGGTRTGPFPEKQKVGVRNPPPTAGQRPETGLLDRRHRQFDGKLGSRVQGAGHSDGAAMALDDRFGDG